MNDRPLTWFLVTALGLWGIWLWRTKRLAAPLSGSDSGGGGTLAPEDQPPGGKNAGPASFPGPGPSAYGLDSLARMLT